MIKFTIVTLVVIILLVESIEPCNKLLLKSVAVAVCGSKKRSFSSNNLWPLLRLGMASDIEREYQKLIDGFDEEELLLKKSDEKKSKESIVKPQRPSHLSIYLDRMGSRTVPRRQLDQDVDISSVRKRDLWQKIEECCVKKCTTEDFKGFCDKK